MNFISVVDADRVREKEAGERRRRDPKEAIGVRPGSEAFEQIKSNLDLNNNV